MSNHVLDFLSQAVGCIMKLVVNLTETLYNIILAILIQIGAMIKFVFYPVYVLGSTSFNFFVVLPLSVIHHLLNVFYPVYVFLGCGVGIGLSIGLVSVFINNFLQDSV